MRALYNGPVILPDRIVYGMAVLFDGKIRAIVKDDSIPADAERIDAEGGYILPGFVDIHVHGGGGGDFLDGTEEAVRAVTRCHGAHGTTSLLATTLTCANETMESGIEKIVSVMESGSDGAEILGLRLEGPYFSGEARGAQNIQEERVFTPEEAERFWKLSHGKIRFWDGAPELRNSEAFGAWLREKHIPGSIGHSAANAETALMAYGWGFRHVTHMYCATTTEHKENGVVHGGIIEAAYLEDGFDVELIGDGKHIPRETMRVVFKLKGADKVALITDAMRAAGTDMTLAVLGSIKDGTEVLVEDGVAKLKSRVSFAGSIATMDHCLRTAVGYGLPLLDAVRAATLTPAKMCHADDRKGSIAPGKDADLLVMDRALSVRKVFFKGKD